MLKTSAFPLRPIEAGIRYWHLADIRLVRRTCLLLTQSGHYLNPFQLF